MRSAGVVAVRPHDGEPVTAMLEVQSASKWYGSVVAVSDVSFQVGPGVTALLGPNGAGKSTMLRLLSGLTRPSRGTVRLLGEDPHDNPELYRRIGLVPQQEALFPSMAGRDFVRLAADLHELPDPMTRATDVMRTLELDPGDRRPLSTWSKGMKQRLKVAQALVHDPEVLVLDEPLDGLDPRQRLHLIDIFRRLGDDGRCVLVSSHVLEEVERLGSRVLVLAQGRLAAEGDFHQIRELMADRPNRLRIRTDRVKELAAALVSTGLVDGVTLDGDSLFVDTSDLGAFGRAVAPAARDAQARLFELVPLDDDLESVFRYLVGRS
jgi:ABC-2 type transport system ATP-binding protein